MKLVALTLTLLVAGAYSCYCPPLYNPLCASNFKNYPSDCEMRCDSPYLTVLWRGTCENPDPAQVVNPVVNPIRPLGPVVTPIGPYVPPYPARPNVYPIGRSPPTVYPIGPNAPVVTPLNRLYRGY